MYEKVTYFYRNSTPLHVPVPPPSGDDSATTAWVAAVVAAGGTVSATQRGYVNDLIVGLKADGLWTVLDRIWLMGGESVSQQATIDIINLGVATPQGTLPLTAAGYTGNFVDGVFVTDLTPSSGTHNYAQDSASLGWYAQEVNPGGGTAVAGVAVSHQSDARDFHDTNVLRTNMNSGTTTDFTVTVAGGSYLVSRTGATAGAAYRTGASLGTFSDASTGLPAAAWSFFARNDGGGTFAQFYGGQLSAGILGGGLDATQAANLNTRITTYMTDWGINV